jgi:hypothetical protein
MNCSEGRCEEKWLPQHSLNQRIADEAESWLAAQSYPKEYIDSRLVHRCNALFYWLNQAEYEKSVPYIDRPDTLKKHIGYSLADAGIENSAEALLEASNVPRLISFLQSRISQYDPFTHEWR